MKQVGVMRHLLYFVPKVAPLHEQRHGEDRVTGQDGAVRAFVTLPFGNYETIFCSKSAPFHTRNDTSTASGARGSQTEALAAPLAPPSQLDEPV